MDTITFSDLFFKRSDGTSPTSMGVRQFHILMTVLIVCIIVALVMLFVFPGKIINVDNHNERLSVARTNMPLNSHLYRTRDVIYENQSRLRPRVFTPNENPGGLSHVEPWDRWNPIRCGGRWINDPR